jgi:hypothetical protein
MSSSIYLVWFAALALAVLGPLLRPGYLLLLDAPAGPHFELPSFFPVPSEGQQAVQASPALFLHRLSGFLHPQLPNKLTVAAIIFLGGVGLYRFLLRQAGLRPASAVVGGTVFVINPFVYDRILAGQLLILLAYALLPWALAPLTRFAQRASRIDLLVGLAWIAGISIVDIHVGGMALLLLISSIVFSPERVLIKLFLIVLTVVGLLAINSYWVLPSLFSNESARLGVGDFIAYSPRPRSPEILPRVLLLHGFWRLEFPSPLDERRTLFLATWLPIAATAIYGMSRAAGARKWVRPTMALGAACLVSLVLGMGRSFALTAPAAKWLFTNFPGYGIYREPQKLIGLLALAYGVFVAVGLDRLETRLQRFHKHFGTAVVVAAALPLLATNLLWGFGGRADVSQFPDGWTRADEATAGEEGSVLIFPWYLYQPVNFAGFRTIANPAPEVFRMPTLVSGAADLFVRRETPPSDPRDIYVTRLLNDRGRLENFGHLVAPLGVHYIALAHISDFGSYRFLDRQPDLRQIFSSGEMTLYENLAFSGTSYSLREGSSATNLTGVLASPAEQERAATKLTPLPASSATKSLPGPAFAEGLPGWDRIDAVDTPVVGTDRSCLDGWRLGNEEPVCHLGALAAFRSPGTDVPLWRPGIALQILAYLISACAVGALILVILKVRGTDEKTPRTEWGSSPTSDGR